MLGVFDMYMFEGLFVFFGDDVYQMNDGGGLYVLKCLLYVFFICYVQFDVDVLVYVFVLL